MEKLDSSRLLEIKGVSKHFGGVAAVKGCDIEIGKGKITALIGPNGAGKTTLFNIVSGILSPDEGEVVLDGDSIVSKSVEQISNLGISRLLQHSHMFNNLTIQQNLDLAINDTAANFWQSIFGISKPDQTLGVTADDLLGKFNLLGKKETTALELSFGQSRLVELVRALVNPHKLLMLDEPVAGIAPPLREEIGRVLKEWVSAGDTVLLIEHDMAFTLSIADKVIVLDKGEIIAVGTPEHVRNDQRVLDAYLG